MASFIATGRRTVMIGENDSWTTWNGQLMDLVGGGVTNTCSWAAAATVYVHTLTAGVNAVTNTSGSVSTGGTALFSSNFATLWGGPALL